MILRLGKRALGATWELYSSIDGHRYLCLTLWYRRGRDTTAYCYPSVRIPGKSRRTT